MRRTLHEFVMREAASTGRPKIGLTPARRALLRHAAENEGTLAVGADGVRRVRRATLAACAEAGWLVSTGDANFGGTRFYDLTAAGRAALAQR